MNIYEIAFYFIICAFAGWVIEVVYYSIEERHIATRGFVIAPFLPIYGFGALISLFLYKTVGNHIFIFAIAAAIALTAFEYFSGVFLEKAFKRKWWDYDLEAFNLNGRICLKNSVYWIILSSLGVYILFPFIQKLLDFIPGKVGELSVLFFVVIITIDAALGSFIIVYNDEHFGKMHYLRSRIKKIPGVKRKLQIE